MNEAHERGDTEEAKRLYRKRADVLLKHANWYHVNNQKLHA